MLRPILPLLFAFTGCGHTVDLTESRQSEGEPDGPCLHIEPTEIDFGSIRWTPSTRCPGTIQIRNTCDRETWVFVETEGRFGVDDPKRLQPGETRDLRICARPEQSGLMEDTLTLSRMDSTGETHEIPLKAEFDYGYLNAFAFGQFSGYLIEPGCAAEVRLRVVHGGDSDVTLTEADLPSLPPGLTLYPHESEPDLPWVVSPNDSPRALTLRWDGNLADGERFWPAIQRKPNSPLILQRREIIGSDDAVQVDRFVWDILSDPRRLPLTRLPDADGAIDVYNREEQPSFTYDEERNEVLLDETPEMGAKITVVYPPACLDR